MDKEANKPAEQPLSVANIRRASDLCEVETYFRDKGGSEFRYDADLDVFRFAEDGRFAFCPEFADWKLMRERGYLDP